LRHSPLVLLASVSQDVAPGVSPSPRFQWSPTQLATIAQFDQADAVLPSLNQLR
jgi:predicted pyridoxine 5'-phosphate oxidase superfamily flavin-nucleotide-binding protein